MNKTIEAWDKVIEITESGLKISFGIKTFFGRQKGAVVVVPFKSITTLTYPQMLMGGKIGMKLTLKDSIENNFDVSNMMKNIGKKDLVIFEAKDRPKMDELADIILSHLS